MTDTPDANPQHELAAALAQQMLKASRAEMRAVPCADRRPQRMQRRLRRLVAIDLAIREHVATGELRQRQLDKRVRHARHLLAVLANAGTDPGPRSARRLEIAGPGMI